MPQPRGEQLSQTTGSSPATQTPASPPPPSSAIKTLENSSLKNSTTHLLKGSCTLQSALPWQGSPVAQRTATAGQNWEHLCQVSAHTCAGLLLALHPPSLPFQASFLSPIPHSSSLPALGSCARLCPALDARSSAKCNLNNGHSPEPRPSLRGVLCVCNPVTAQDGVSEVP